MIRKMIYWRVTIHRQKKQFQIICSLEPLEREACEVQQLSPRQRCGAQLAAVQRQKLRLFIIMRLVPRGADSVARITEKRALRTYNNLLLLNSGYQKSA